MSGVTRSCHTTFPGWYTPLELMAGTVGSVVQPADSTRTISPTAAAGHADFQPRRGPFGSPVKIIFRFLRSR